MHLTLRQLNVFDSVARNLSYTRAAEELHLSQPAVSMQVRQLEEAVGLPLFEKLGKKIFLTEAGRELHRYGQSVAQQLQELEEVMESLKGLTHGHLRISVATTANHFATRILAAFSRRYPGTTFALDVTNRASLLDQLAANETDLVIMGKPPGGLALAAEAFMDNPLVVIAPPDHQLAIAQSDVGSKGRAVSLERIQEETFVVREMASGTRIAMERHFDRQGTHLRTGMEMNSNEAIKQAVEAGLGLGIVSVHTLELELETARLVVLDVGQFPILRHWYLVHRKGRRLPPIAAAFREFLLGEESRPLMAGTAVAASLEAAWRDGKRAG